MKKTKNKQTKNLPIGNWADEGVGYKLNYSFGRKHHPNDHGSVSEKLMPGHRHRNSVGLGHIALGPTLRLYRNIFADISARCGRYVGLGEFLEIFHEPLWLGFIGWWGRVVADGLDHGRLGHVNHNAPCLVPDDVFALNLIQEVWDDWYWNEKIKYLTDFSGEMLPNI